MPHRLDPLLARPDLQHRDLARFLRLETEAVETLVGLARTERRVGSRERAAKAFGAAARQTADLRNWLDRAAGQGIHFPAVRRHVQELERTIGDLRQRLASEAAAPDPDLHV